MSKREGGQIKIHKIDIERVASEYFRIFVCEGQPKTITAPNDALTYHDGSRYATALVRKKFTKVILLPDLVAGNILHRSCSQATPIMHLVMLGANGLEYVPADESKNHPMNSEAPCYEGFVEQFRHSSGHMAIAALTKLFKKNAEDTVPRLLLVLGTSKCDEKPKKGQNTADSVNKKAIGQCSEGVIKEKDGYRFWSIEEGESVRDEPFLVRDEAVRRDFYENHICLYIPREDAVPLNMVNDIILDFGFFTNVGTNTTRLREELTKRIRRENE